MTDHPFIQLGKEVYLTPLNKAAELLGVNYSYLKKKSSLSDSKAWKFTDFEGRRMLAYSPLKAEYKSKVEAVYGNPFAYLQSLSATAKATQLAEERQEEEQRRQEAAEAFEAGTSTEEFHEIRANWPDRTERSIHTINAMLYAGSVLRFCISATPTYCKSLGFDSKDGLLEWVLALPEVRRNACLKGAKSLVQFRRKMRDYKEEGWRSLVSAKVGNQNSAKLSTPLQKTLVRTLYNQHNSPGFDMVADAYNAIASEKGWKQVTRRTIERYLTETPGVLLQASTNRLSQRQWEGKFMPSILRERPSEAGLLWVADSTPAELYFQEGKKTWCRLNMCLVIDAYNDTILGWSFADEENAELIADAWRMAIANTGLMPVEAKMDRFSLKALTPFYESIALHVRPSKAGNAKDKIIEPLFRRLNEQEFKKFHNWSGSGVKAKMDKSQPNSDFTKKGREFFPHREEVVKQILTSLQSWNEGRYEKWKKSAEGNAKARRAGRTDMIDLFGGYLKHTNYRYGTGGVQLSANGQKLNYRIWQDEEAYMLMAGRDDLRIKMLPEDPSLVKAVNSKGQSFWLSLDSKEKMAFSDAGEGDRVRLNVKLRFQQAIFDKAKEAAASDRALLGSEGIALSMRDAEALTKGFFVVDGGNKHLLGSSEQVLKSFQEEKPERPTDFYDNVKLDFSQFQSDDDD